MRNYGIREERQELSRRYDLVKTKQGLPLSPSNSIKLKEIISNTEFRMLNFEVKTSAFDIRNSLFDIKIKMPFLKLIALPLRRWKQKRIRLKKTCLSDLHTLYSVSDFRVLKLGNKQ